MEELRYKVEVFEGPLDLLLALITKNKLDILDIPIAELVEQYLEQIRLMREANMDLSSEFLTMAARLVRIKTASLLPRDEEEEDPRLELAGELIEYEQCKQAAAALRDIARFDTVTREPLALPADMTYNRRHDPKELLSALLSADGRGRSLAPPKRESFKDLVEKKIVSVTSQVISVLLLLRRNRRLSLRSIFSQKKDRSTKVAAFLAVLELMKNRRIRVDGEGESAEVTLTGEAGERWIERA